MELRKKQRAKKVSSGRRKRTAIREKSVSLPLLADQVFLAAFVGQRRYLLDGRGFRHGMKIGIDLPGAHRNRFEEERLSVHLNIHARHFPTARSDFLLFHVKGAAFIEMPQETTCEFDLTVQAATDF